VRSLKQNTETGAPTRVRRILRVAAFGFSSAFGFLVAEAVIVMGLFAIFGKLELPGDMSSSPSLVGLDVLALVIGVAASFALNERTTVRDVKGRTKGVPDVIGRLGRFEGVSAVGNAVIIVVQLALLSAFGLSPALGSVVGALVGFPVSYFMSMRIVWKVKG
jgi:putative flippase GtrA